MTLDGSWAVACLLMHAGVVADASSKDRVIHITKAGLSENTVFLFGNQKKAKEKRKNQVRSLG